MSDQEWLDVALEEYKSLRTESLTAMANQQATLRFGMTALGTALALAVNAKEAERFLLFSVLIPIFSLLFFCLYAIEFERMARVGIYIKNVEQNINLIFPLPQPAGIHFIQPPLGWETWLSTENKNGKTRLRYYWSIPLIFISVTIFSSGMAFLSLEKGPFGEWNLWLLLAIFILVMSVIFYIIWNLLDAETHYKDLFKTNH
jgi:hypothetical protein